MVYICASLSNVSPELIIIHIVTRFIDRSTFTNIDRVWVCNRPNVTYVFVVYSYILRLTEHIFLIPFFMVRADKNKHIIDFVM